MKAGNGSTDQTGGEFCHMNILVFFGKEEREVKNVMRGGMLCVAYER